MMSFIVGLFIGGVVGAFAMALCQMAGEADLTELRFQEAHAIYETHEKAKQKKENHMAKIKFKKLSETAISPSQAHPGDAGWDLYSDRDCVIAPEKTEFIGTGIAIALPKYTFGAIYARSGLAAKQGLRPANCVGICDSQYRGEYIVPLHNDSQEYRSIKKGDRIAQLIIQPYIPAEMEEAWELDDTERGVGGFGSTGR